MPFKLLGTVILLVLVTVFCGFNNGDGYRCNVNLLFRTFTDVPVFLTVIASFACGMIVTLPFTFGKRRRRADRPDKAGTSEKTPQSKKQRSQAHGSSFDAPEVKVTVRPGTLYEDALAAGTDRVAGSEEHASAAPSSGAATAVSASQQTPAATRKSPFAQARENAKQKKARLKAEKEAKAQQKNAEKKSAEKAAPSVNDVPKIQR